jgi:hypothetical protein
VDLKLNLISPWDTVYQVLNFPTKIEAITQAFGMA